MNRQIVHREIIKKKSAYPYFPENNLIFQVKTDVNEFPYRRFFRGKMDEMNPNIWDREAGYSPIKNSIDTTNKVNQSLLLGDSTCFQYPCSTILPCIGDNNTTPFQANSTSKVYISP